MTKTYLKRDGAAAACRKAGIPREDYDKHISKVEGGFAVNLPDAVPAAKANKVAHVKAHLEASKATVKEKNAAKVQAKKAKTDKAPRVSIGSTIRELIKQGKNNAEIWPIIKKQFSMDDSKKWYPAWYRSDLARRKAAK